jgi:predicted thioesterase
MKPTLAPGLATTRRLTVDEKRTIGFMGEEGRVYATPELVRDIEMTCRELLLEHADPGEDSVGMRVEIDHLAPTPLGLEVEITATVAEMKGRVVTFEVRARDTLDEIAKGRHVRFVAETEKSKQRVAAKLAKARAA